MFCVIVTLYTASILLPAVAAARESEGAPGSATWVIPGCREAPTDTQVSNYRRGFCAGAVRTIIETDERVCPPGTATNGQAIRVVVQYIDARPARQHESFAFLAMDALRAAWPCRR